MARTTMAGLISRLRSVTGASPDDEFQGETYWSDDQLEAELDMVCLPVTKCRLEPTTDSPVTVFRFGSPRGYWIESLFVVKDASGNIIDANTYTVQPVERGGLVTFNAPVTKTGLTINYTVYDWNAAAAAIWEQKAAHRFDYINFKSGDHKFDARAEYETCVQRAQWHASRKIKAFSVPRRGFVAAAKTDVRVRS